MYLQIITLPYLCFSINKKIWEVPIFPEVPSLFFTGNRHASSLTTGKETFGRSRFVAHIQTSEGLGKEK